MNRSLRAAGGVLATAATVTIVLVAVAMVDPQATALQNGDHDEGAGSGNDASNGDPRSMAHWYRLGEQLDDLETRNDKPLNHLADVCHRDVSGIGFGHER